MKGTKTSLFLLELMISLLLFSFCAAICVQIFHASNKRTESAEDLSKAVFEATTLAELYKANGGDLQAVADSFNPVHAWYMNDVLSVYFDENWNETMMPMLRSSYPAPPGYTVQVSDNGDSSADIKVIKTASITEYSGNSGEFTVIDSNVEIFAITVKAVA